MQEDFKSIRRLRYPLPDVVTPAESVCIEVHVPNDIGYISAFWGQMFALTRWYAWAGDTGHTAKDVAAVWRGVYEAAQESECENVLVRTNPFNSCELQVSYDGGVVWVTKFDARPCAITAINDTLGSGSDNGAGRSQPGSQPGGSDPAPNQCFDLDLTVKATGPTLIPLNIQSGWTLHLSEVKGAWADGSFLARWYCPNGNYFSLGACASGSHDAGYSTDPLTSAYHMQLILRHSDGSFAAIPFNADYVVPVGMPDGNYWLQANDSPLNDNAGDVTLHLLACNTDAIAITYIDIFGGTNYPTGPSTCLNGETVTIHSSGPTAFQGANIYFVVFSVPMCCTMEVISVTGATLFAQEPSNNVPKEYRDCSNVLQNHISVSAGGTLIAAGVTWNLIELICDSATPFDIVVRLTRV